MRETQDMKMLKNLFANVDGLFTRDIKKTGSAACVYLPKKYLRDKYKAFVVVIEDGRNNQ